MKFLVSKFGGSSVASTERIQQVGRILKLDKRRRCVVVSAPGKAPGADIKVTDLLIGIVAKVLRSEDASALVAQVHKRYAEIYEPLGISSGRLGEIMANLDARLAVSEPDPAQFRDSVVAAGEDLNAQLVAEYLKLQGEDAVYVSPAEAGLVVTSDFGDAQPLEDTALSLAGLKKVCAEKIVVFPGFFGVTESGQTATFSRGGSDLTGAILAEAIEAEEYENWTDVDGICSANPTIVANPKQISALTYREMRELSYIGFGVLHQEAVAPAMRKKIPIRLRNTMNLANAGTLIVAERLPSESDVIGIASGGQFASFTLQKYLMNREKGFGRKLLSILEEMNLSYEHCPSSVDSISVILDQTQLHSGIVHNIVREIEQRLQPDDLAIEFGMALIGVVGEGLYHKHGVLAAAAGALAEAGVNIQAVNQGSSEISMIFGVDASDEKKAVNALYQRFFRGE